MFTGFTPETIDFLWGLRLNNNRDWFTENKEVYQKTLYAPMKELSQQVFEPFQDVPNMAHKLSRIYKDARMHPKVPYKESLWFSMRPDDLPWSEQPTLFFEIIPEGYHYGFVLWKPKAEITERWRNRMVDHPRELPQLIRKLEKETGISFAGESYYRKKPCPSRELEPWFHLKSMTMEIRRSPDELLFSPELVQEVTKTLQALYPLYEYCLKFTI